jgi:hypothetical protein
VKRSRAAFAAIAGLTLTASAVAAAAPSLPDAASHGTAVMTLAQDESATGGTNDNHGGAVSTLAKGDHGAPAAAPTGDTAPTTTTPTSAQNAHGLAVKAVAQDKTAVGGTNNNHGGAVSAVARGDHGPAAAPPVAPTRPSR